MATAKSFTLDEESQPETSIGKGETETDKAEGSIREVDKNESSIDEKGGETKNSATGEGEMETVREKQVDEDVTKLFQSIQDDPITREIGTGRNSSQLRKEEDGWEGSSDRIPTLEELAGIPTLEELAGLTIDEVTKSGELIVATRSKPPISDEDKRELVEHSVRRQIRRKNYTNEDASAETKPLELTPEELWKQEFERREKSGVGIQRKVGECKTSECARAMIVAKEGKRSGSYDALRWTEEQEREPEGMPELDRGALCDDSIVEECDEDDTPRDNKKKKKLPRRRRKKHVRTAYNLDEHARKRESEVTRLMSLRNSSKPMEPFPRWERFATRSN